MLDTTKWTEIYNKHSKKMLWVCKRYVNDVSLAEDLLHEGFIIAMQKQNTFSGFGSFEGWLQKIMVNTSLLYLRNNKNKLFASDIEISDNTTVTTDMNLAYDIKNKIINTDFTQQELLEAVNAIPEHHKMVFNMYVIDDFSHNEISKTLDITTNTSKSHLFRARKKIQELLYLKAKDKEQNKDRKRLFFWFLFTSSTYVDSIYAKSFLSFDATPSKPFNIETIIKQQNLPEKITSGYIFGITLQKFVVTSISIIVFVSAFFYFFYKENSFNQNKTVVNEIPNFNKETETNQTSIRYLLKDSLENNKIIRSINVKKEDSISLTNKEGLTSSIEKSNDETTKHLKTTNQSKKTVRKRNKNPVVIKKIIDTIYVYK
jgi:RNA polymerase sigma factor (sigma-70 family)